MRDLDKFKGCLIGGAIGDALGYPVEFMSDSEISRRYGDAGVTDFQLRNGVAEISNVADTPAHCGYSWTGIGTAGTVHLRRNDIRFSICNEIRYIIYDGFHRSLY